MATMLNQYAAHRALNRISFAGWRDLSDLDSIGFAVGNMRTRPYNRITRASATMLEKHSEHPDFRAEVQFFRELDATRAHFFPRCEIVDDTRYRLDYIDLPTLAQLYLYWPAQPNHWSGILRTITDAMTEEFWPPRSHSNLDELRLGGQDMYINKTRLRLRQWADPMAGRDELWINDSRCVAGEKLMRYLMTKLQHLAYNPIPAFLHGDLNFANILYSLYGRTFQLIDPRGAWSDYGPVGDLRYELAKLRYSYNGMFNAICDGLYTLQVTGSTVTFDLGPERQEEICACDQVIGEFADIRDLHLIEAALLLSAPPLHGGPGESEPRALYIRGVQLANELLDGGAA